MTAKGIALTIVTHILTINPKAYTCTSLHFIRGLFSEFDTYLAMKLVFCLPACVLMMAAVGSSLEEFCFKEFTAELR
jgi:hypothetical protein